MRKHLIIFYFQISLKNGFKMVKLAYITTARGGLASFTYREIENLLERNINIVLLLTKITKGPYQPSKYWNCNILNFRKIFFGIFSFLCAHPVIFFSLFKKARQTNTKKYFFITLGFWNVLKKDVPNRIHSQMGNDKLIIAYYIHKIFQIPLTTTIHAHELYLSKTNEYKKIDLSYFLNKCDNIITISKFNKRLLTRNFNIQAEKISVFRLYVPINRINEEINKNVIIFISAQWVKKKGHKNLFEAIKHLNRDDIVVWVTGEYNGNNAYIDLKKLAKELGVENHIRFLGKVTDDILHLLFRNCDIFCLPSVTVYDEHGNVIDREGIPVSIMEAMAYGKPVISTKHAGIPELVDEILVEENNVEELKNAIEYLLKNPEKWKEMGKRNRTIIEEKYSNKNVEKLITIFNSDEERLME